MLKTFLIFIKSQYVRDAQAFEISKNLDLDNENIHKEKYDDNWVDVGGDVLVASLIKESLDDVRQWIEKIYPNANFDIFRIVSSEGTLTECGETEYKTKTLRITIDLQMKDTIEAEEGKELGCTPDELKNGVVLENSYDVDGYELTTNIEGCDNTTDFFIESGKIVSKEWISRVI